MSRHRRGNSDLEGIKTLKNLKRSFNGEKETIGRINRAFSNMETPSQNTSGKLNSCPETPPKKYETSELIQNTLKLAKHFYEEDHWDFYSKLRMYLKSGWEAGRKAFIEHLNKLPYMEQGMQKKTYSEIEEEILREWKKNTVLYHLRSIWYEHTRDIKFKAIEDFVAYYNIFRDFVGQVIYLYFRGFFTALEKKSSEGVVDRLTERTAHFVITNSSTWCKLFDKVVRPLFYNKMKISQQDEISEISLKEFDIREIEPSPYAIDISRLEKHKLSPRTQSSLDSSPTDTTHHKKSIRQEVLPNTTEQLFKFIHESKLMEKIKLLATIRECLEAEIQSHQKQLIEKKEMDNYKVLDKDDFISCLICCVVYCDDISLENLGVSIKFFHYLLGPNYPEVLSKFSSDSYLADLEAVYEFLLEWKTKKSKEFRSLADIEIINYNSGTALILGGNRRQFQA